MRLDLLNRNLSILSNYQNQKFGDIMSRFTAVKNAAFLILSIFVFNLSFVENANAQSQPVGFVANPVMNAGQVFLACGPIAPANTNVVYRLFYSLTATAPANPLTATQYPFGTTPGDGGGTAAFGFNLSGLMPGQGYSFWLYQFNTATSTYSTPALVTQNAGVAGPPAMPAGFVANPAGGSGQVFLSCGPNNVGANNIVYRLFYSPTATAPANPLTATQYPFGTIPGDGGGTAAFGFNLGGLTPGTGYTFWLYQYNTVTAQYSAPAIATQTSGGTSGPSTSPYCATTVTHFGGDPASAILLTIKNTGTNSMEVRAESANADAVDLLIVNGGSGAAVSAPTNPSPGVFVITLTWAGTPPGTVNLNVLWSKVSFPGNWQLSQANVNIAFNATCPSTPAPGAPTTGGPNPICASSNVISLFSNAYTNVPVNTWLTPWSAAPATVTDVVIAGNDVKFYQDVTFIGIETTGANRINATNMTSLRLDFWSGNATQFRIKLVDWGANGNFGGGDDSEHELTFTSPTQNAWVSYDIPLVKFCRIDFKSQSCTIYIISDAKYSG
jgi:hypothetical protein